MDTNTAKPENESRGDIVDLSDFIFYHGTSDYFLPGILKDGLGGKRPPEVELAVDVMRVCYANLVSMLMGQIPDNLHKSIPETSKVPSILLGYIEKIGLMENWHDDAWSLINKFEISAPQRNLGYFDYGYAYVAADKKKALGYLYNSHKSESISQAFLCKMYSDKIGLNLHVPEQLQQCFDIKHNPIIIKCVIPDSSYLIAERGNLASSTLEIINKMIANKIDSDFWDIRAQMYNFRLSRQIKIDIDKIEYIKIE